jgi:hypothetical protein
MEDLLPGCHGIAWAVPVTGDFDSALPAALVALDDLRHQDEPLWIALAAGSQSEWGTGSPA